MSSPEGWVEYRGVWIGRINGDWYAQRPGPEQPVNKVVPLEAASLEGAKVAVDSLAFIARVIRDHNEGKAAS